jgi:NAD(P) transhydrogenase subunit alpha
MKIAVAKERRAHECRVAASTDTVKKLIALGAQVVVEVGAGEASSISDSDYEAAGAAIAPDYAAAVGAADVVLKVRRPLAGNDGSVDELAPLSVDTVLLCLMAPHIDREELEACARKGVTAFAMELMPRITRAQIMDALSSQSNLAGYEAVIEAAQRYNRAFPMMMTAAGTIPPARVVVLGAGVAGLQAIATARRMGAIVSAFDVRAAAKEQVESLGATFVEVEGSEDAETAAGYAREVSEDHRRCQAEALHAHLKKQDIAISTALIPGRPAPVLITEEMVRDMKLGSVIVDLAVEAGGNCALSELDQVVVRHGVTIVGYTDMASRVAADASQLYARNLLNFLTPMIDPEVGGLDIDWSDEIVSGTLVTRGGAIVHPSLAPPAAAAAND